MRHINDNSPKIQVWSEPWNDTVSLRIVAYDHRAAVNLIEFVPVEEGEVVPPSLIISRTEAQALMDSLWSVGLRPTEGRGSAGAMAATESHLEDMRALVFAKLKVSKP